jgi:hypothetical protein
MVYAGFAYLLHPPLWCGDEPAELTTEALTESVWRSRLQIGVEISVTREGLLLIGSKAEAVTTTSSPGMWMPEGWAVWTIGMDDRHGRMQDRPRDGQG